MDVFVIPTGPDRYELYCEQPFAREAAATARPGLLGTIQQRIEDLLRRAEQWEPAEPQDGQGFLARINNTAMAWVADRVAEQRLLWNLRRERTVTAVHPDDLTLEQVHAIVRHCLQQDFERHQYWVWVDGVLFVLTSLILGPLFLLIPGIANLPAVYFGFRTIGHWYSRRGARHGMRDVEWVGRASAPLSELRLLRQLPPQSRDREVHDIAVRLGLQNLSAFYDRVCGPSL